VEVTVFPDRAEVVREARVEIPAGISTVQFTGLPWQVEPDSLRVSARGVPASLGAVEMKEQAGDPEETAELTAAREEVRRLEVAMNGLALEVTTAKDLREFIASLKASAAQRESGQMGEGRADPASLQAMYALIRTSLQDLAKEELARGDRQRELQKELDVAKARLASTRPAGAIRTRLATVEVEAQRAGSLTVRLAYLAPGASWRPAYRASLDAATGQISLDSEAVVRQSTGEDWSGVEMKLSTAAPARGVSPPELASLLLRPMDQSVLSAAGGDLKGLPVLGRNYQDLLKLKGGVTDSAAEPAAEADEQAARLEADVVHSSYNVVFTVPGRSDVPADGRDHRAGLRQETLSGQVEYRTVPGLNAAAYLVAKAPAPKDYPLLSGPVRVFAGGAYLGSFALNETVPGQEFSLPFGVDNRIRVERTPLPQARSHEGITGKDRRIAYAFRTTVENLRDQNVTLVVEDRVPVSEDERVVVERGKETTAGAEEVKDRPGVIEWKLTLEPRQKRDIVLAYSVRFPKEMIVPGIE